MHLVAILLLEMFLLPHKAKKNWNYGFIMMVLTIENELMELEN